MPLLDQDNHLLGLARSGRRLPPVWLALALAVVFVFGGQLIGGIVGLPIFLALGGPEVPRDLPIIVMTLVYITTPSYIALLWTTQFGQFLLAAAGMWMMTGVLVMRKMINFKY